uniref:ADH_N_2 domain-containing protein n=1 Tax=Steinernema glaseri TaxID=37863 RepID=A0A1I7YQW5_9BILA
MIKDEEDDQQPSVAALPAESRICKAVSGRTPPQAHSSRATRIAKIGKLTRIPESICTAEKGDRVVEYMCFAGLTPPDYGSVKSHGKLIFTLDQPGVLEEPWDGQHSRKEIGSDISKSERSG